MNKEQTKTCNPEILIQLTEFDANLFLEFQRYHDIFALMVAKKVFEQKGAAITIHFDNQGHLKTITRADVLYLSGKEFDNTN